MSYTDLTSAFEYKQILPWTRMDALAENDSFEHFPSGTKTFFYQSSLPAGWTKETGIDDRAVRVVSGAGGGTGGSAGLSTTVTLAHTHGGGSHSHAGYDHQHDLDYTSSSSFNMSPSQTCFVSSGALRSQTGTGIGNVLHTYPHNRSAVDGSADSSSSDTLGTTNSQLSNIAFAYCDVLIASKDA